MSGISIEKGKTIYEAGQPLSALHMITEGQVTVGYPGGTYTLTKGDIIGVSEICSDVHFLSYVAATDVSLVTYVYKDISSLDDLFEKHKEIARFFVVSTFRQINIMLQNCALSEPSCSNYYQSLRSDYMKYVNLCNRYRLNTRTLDQWNDINAYLGDEAADLWLGNFYIGLAKVYAGENYKDLVADPAISTGFLRKCSLDYRRTFYTLEEQNHYQQQIVDCYFNDSGNDMFDFFTSLYYKLDANCDDAGELFADINRMILMFSPDAKMDSAILDARIAKFQDNIMASMNENAIEKVAEEESQSINELRDSLNDILDFAGPEFEGASSFRLHINQYKNLVDKFSSDDDATQLRATLTSEFYELYSIIFKNTLESAQVPIPVLMFLYFGFVDEELAGASNTLYLYEIIQTIADHSDKGVYTFYDWLLAIYLGKKEPSRNEFDQDYTEFLHRQKLTGEITEAEFKVRESDTMEKVKFELQNAFPVLNKITYGRITAYCPIFISENVLKDLKSAFVDLTSICKAFERIKKIDFSAYYRESYDLEHSDTMGKEQIHLEYIPDVILMPNVGIRGSMWQEIEGKRRNTPGRFAFSLFHMEDIELTMIRLTAEFRWEMCKRIQGSRWNDVTDRSLTSEYFDYVQFYKKNRELTQEAKDHIRTSLQRAKNSFREMFVRDYLIWIIYEGNGSPRLNKIARKILFTYCPFEKSVRKSIASNPIYSDLLYQFERQAAVKVKRLNTLTLKIQNSKKPVPKTLVNELKFADGDFSN